MVCLVTPSNGSRKLQVKLELSLQKRFKDQGFLARSAEHEPVPVDPEYFDNQIDLLLEDVVQEFGVQDQDDEVFDKNLSFKIKN